MYIEVGNQILNGKTDYVLLLTLWNEYTKMTGKIFTYILLWNYSLKIITCYDVM